MLSNKSPRVLATLLTLLVATSLPGLGCPLPMCRDSAVVVAASQIPAPYLLQDGQTSNRLAVPPFSPTGHFETTALPGGKISPAPGGVVFLLNSQDIFKSDDGGYLWQALIDPLSAYSVASLAVSPSFDQDHTLFAGTSYTGDGVRISSDGGRSWRSPQELIPGPVSAVAVSPNFASDHTVYAAVNNYSSAQLFYSTDGGDHWVSLGTLWPSGVKEMVLSPSFAANRTLFVRLADHTVWGSADGGVTWNRIDHGLTSYDNPIDDLETADLGGNGTSLYVATNWGLIVTYDVGQTWYLASQSHFFVVKASPDFATSRTLYALKASWKVQRSTNGGADWQNLMPGESVSDMAISPHFLTDHTIYARNTYYFWVSHDSGQSWTVTSTPLPWTAEYRFELLASPNFDQDGTAFAFSDVPDGPVQFLKSTDAAVSWTMYLLPGTSTQLRMAISPDFANDQTLFAALDTLLYKSTDGGQSWVQQGGNLPTFYASILHLSPNYAADHTVFVGGYYTGVFRSTDDGLTWTQIAAPYVTDLDISPGYPADPTLFINRYNDGILRSDDGGQTWIQLGNPMFTPEFMIALSPTFPQDHTLFVANSGMSNGGAFRSNNRGNTWIDITGEVLNTGVEVIAVSPRFAQDQTVIMAPESRSVYISEDAGEHWFELQGAPNSYRYPRAIITYDDGLLQPIVSTPRSFYRYRWPVLSWQPTHAGVCLQADEMDSVSVQLSLPLAVTGLAQAYWGVSEQAGWLSADPTWGPLPGVVTLTVDPTGLSSSTSTNLTVSAYRSLRQIDSFTVPIRAIMDCKRMLLPVIER